MRKIRKNTIYKHFKGKYYYVKGIAKDATNDGNEKSVVVYIALYDDNKLYIRDLEEFASEVDHEKYPDVKQKYRFQECKFNTILNLFGFNLLHDYGDFVTYISDNGAVLEVSEDTIEYYELDDFLGALYRPVSNKIILLSEIIRYKKFKSTSINTEL